MHDINEKIPTKTSHIYDHDKNVYSGLGIHLPLFENISKPRPVSLSKYEYVSVAIPNMITDINANKHVRAPKVAVMVKHFTDALKFVVAVTTKNIIINEFVIKLKLAIV